MEIKFEREYYLRTSDYDCRLKLNPASILDLFQDAAGCHAESLGIGFEPMLARELLWVVAKIKFQILADPELHQRVRVRTWPLSPTRVGFRREYFIEDEQGKLLVKGSSDWVLMHAKERRLMPARDIYPKDSEFCTCQAFEGRIIKVHDFEGQDTGHPTHPGFSDLDMNGHVNNAKYANYVMDALDLADNEFIDLFQIDYHREVQRGTTLAIHIKREDKEILAKGVNEKGETMFSCRINLR